MGDVFKKIFVVAMIALAIFAVAIFFKFLSDEDGWICANGQWIKHGHPSAPQPRIPCFD